jgi:Fe(3+) dicitrate transport protein
LWFVPALESASLLAQQGPVRQQEEVPEVLIVAEAPNGTQVERTPIDYAAGRDVLGPEEVERAGALSLQEILRRSPSIAVSDETGSDSLPNIALRGISGNDGIFRSVNLTLMADGIPLAGGPYGAPGASGFPLVMERVYAVDIQRGGAAVRYGPNNVAGVVNFLTRPIPERGTIETLLKYNSFNDASFYTGVGGTYDDFGYLAEGVYKFGDTYREHGDYTLQNWSLKSSLRHTDSVRSLIQIERFEDDSDLSDGLSLAQYQADPSQSSSLQNRFAAEQNRLNWRVQWQAAPTTLVEVITYWYDTERTFWLGNPLFYGDAPTFIQATPRPMETWAIQPQVTHKSALDVPGLEGEVYSELLAGVRYQSEDLVRRVERTPAGGVTTLRSDDRYDYGAWSAFVQDKFEWKDWTVTPGVRFEAVGIEADRLAGTQPGVGNTNDQDFVEVLPAISAAYRLDEGWSVYSNIQSSFQAPQAAQIDLLDNQQDVEAQYAWMYEVGTRLQSRDGALAADLCVYQIDYSDKLESDPDQFDVFLNTGRTRHRGVELAVDADLARESGIEGLGAWTSAAWNESEYMNGDFKGNEVTGTPEWLISWGLRYEHDETGIYGGLDGFYVDEAYSDRENTEAINADGTRGLRPSYIVWNAQTGIGMDLGSNCRLRFQLNARNLFNHEYFDVRAARGIYPGAPFGYGAEFGLKFTF